MIFKKTLPLFLSVLLIACIINSSKSSQTVNYSNIYSSAFPVDDTINERGLLKSVEDSGYPMATLTIEFPERKFTEYFIINLEEVKGANINNLTKWVGKYVSFTYTSDLTNDLMDLQVNGKTIFNDTPAELSPETKKVSGILKGANAVTAGDLPDKISIVTKDHTIDFEFFVTPELVKVNGKKVVGFYEENTQNNIKSIKVSR